MRQLPLHDAQDIDRRKIVHLLALVVLKRIYLAAVVDAPRVEILAVLDLLHLDHKARTRVVLAVKIIADALGRERLSHLLVVQELDLHDVMFAVQKSVEQADHHILVPLIPEDCLEAAVHQQCRIAGLILCLYLFHGFISLLPARCEQLSV